MRRDPFDSSICYFEEGDILPENTSFVGRRMRLLKFRGWLDCDIEFPDDGCIVRNVAYGCYHYGNVKHPCDPEEFPYPRIGESNTVRGRRTCIIDGVSPFNVTFMFEDGEAVEHKKARELERGCFGDRNRKSPLADAKYRDCRIGAEFANRQGEAARITKIWPMKAGGPGTACFVDAEFMRDGKAVTVEHVPFSSLRNGLVECPSDEELRAAAALEKVLPMSLMTEDGHLYEIDAAHGLRLDVMVDKVLVRDVPAADYLNGTIRLGKDWRRGRSHIGDRATSMRGQEIVIAAWRGARDIDLLVDGEPALHRQYSNFTKRRAVSDREREESRLRGAEKMARKEERRLQRMQEG